MTKKLRNLSQLKIDPGYRRHLLLPNIILVILYMFTISQLSAQSKDGSFTVSEESISYDFDECRSFSDDGSNYDYSEFTSSNGNSCTSVTGSTLYRYSGKHSCTNDEAGNPGDAACFQSSLDDHYSSDHTLAIRFDITVSGNNGKKGRLDGISFKQLAPHNYLWSAQGYPNNTGPNNYPTKFGIRVLKDGVEISKMFNLSTTQSWYTSEFNFNHNASFMVDAGISSVFTFELFSYAPVGNGAAVSAWDLDDLKVFSSCEEDCTLIVDAGENQSNCNIEEILLTANVANQSECKTITSSYKIIDSNTEAGCFTANPGVIFQKYDDCHAVEYTWRAGDDLVLNEFDNDTAIITGSVIDQNGRVATVNIELSDKEHTGNTWNASCYLDGISGPETFYRSFIGAITVDGVALSVGTRFNAHYILANGAGFDSNQFGLGAWTGGAFGECTEWFGNLVPKTIDNSHNEVNYEWSTADGNIVGNSNQQTITVDKAGTYTATVKDCETCEGSDSVLVKMNKTEADAGEDQLICKGNEATLTATGGGTYLWSTGEITQSITVNPNITTEYSVIVTNGNCEAMDEVMVNVDDKVVIGNYVWLDENRNGMQDDSATGIKGMSVKLYQCNGDLVNSTETNNDGYYQFEVCPGTGDYYVIFGEVPEGLKFTAINQGNDTMDSNADSGGVTACFTITDKDDLTIDAGLIEICDINLEVIEEVKICASEILELTATLTDNTEECEGGCVYPIVEQERCYGPTGDFEIWMWSVTDGKKKYHKFKASEQRFETLDDGSARYTATASDGIDTIEVNAMFTDYTTVPGPNGPKPNDCQQYDMSDWEYWSNWSGTISSQNHGIFTLSMKGTYFQMGIGADVTRSGFGASGWFYAAGGDGYYVDGDINVALEECIEKSATFEWTTQDGNIISDANQKTIKIDRPGTYVIEAVNCIDCVAVKKIVVTEDILCSTFTKSANTPKMMKVYPVPVKSGGTLTIEFDLEDNKNVSGLGATSLKAAVVGNSTKENVVIVVYDMTGRVISAPRTFDIVDSKAVIYLDLDYMPTGKYIVKAMNRTWNDSKNIIVR